MIEAAMVDNPYGPPQVTKEDIVVGRDDFKDRSTGLMVYGSLQILLAAFCALMVPLMAFSGTVTDQAVSAILPAMIMYLGAAIGGAMLGIGSIRRRRWARAITLVGSWMWLITGTVSMVYLLFVLPRMAALFSEQENMPAEFQLFFTLVAGGCGGCLYIAFPAAFVAFYRSAHVKATCEFHNPTASWTDRCPLPVLAMSVALALGSLSSLTSLPSAFSTSVLPLFGTYVAGIPAALVFLVLCLLLATLAYGSYQLRMPAWWATLIVVVFWSASALITFAGAGVMGMYEHMNMPEEQLELIRQMGFANRWPSTVMTAASAALIVGYLVFVRRYFVSSAARKST